MMRPIAVPMVGGMALSAVLTPLVIPAIYAGVKGYGLPNAARMEAHWLHSGAE